MSVVKKLSRDLGDFKIEISDWTLADQGVTVLWGPSGAGKTTILRSLLGLDPVAELKWMWDGQDLGCLPAEKRGLGVVFQDLGLFPHLSAQENIMFPVLKKVHTNWQADFEWLVETLQIGPKLRSKTFSLSGGEKQRVALARALIYRPKMLLLDEPFSSLDEDLRGKSRAMIQQVCQHMKCPVLLVTHDREDVETLAQEVCQIEQGRLVDSAKSLSPKA